MCILKFITLLDCIDENWRVKEKAKSLYRNLGKAVRYDERFMFSKNSSLLEKIYFRNIDIEQDEDERVVCRTVNLIYYELLTRLGIHAEILYKKSKIKRAIQVEDVALVFYDEFGNKIYTNITGDLENCKFGLKTQYFGISKNPFETAQDVLEISESENTEIDRTIQEIQTDYSDIFFEQLTQEVKSPNHFKMFLSTEGIDISTLKEEDILALKMHYITKLVKVHDKTAGFDEIRKFYKKLFMESVLDKIEKKHYLYYEFFKEDGENIDALSVIELSFLEKENIFYVYSNKESSCTEIKMDELLEIIAGYEEKKGRQLSLVKNEKS